ncbi:MAG: hypothetical protein IKC45_06215 [Clostridia bacterium]|nr:hypothetical protein [Clostridia bacterium]
MREIKDFDTEKKIFIGKVLNHIHYNKLHARIYEELSNHMDDMYEDFSSTCDDEKEVTKRVINEMGNPDELGYELKKANKRKLLWVRIFKIIFTVIALPLPYFMWALIGNIGLEIVDFARSYTVSEAEQWIVENKTDGEPIKLLTEIEHNGVIHKIYVPEVQDEIFDIYQINSVKLFGINIKDKFEYNHSTYLSSDEYTIANLNTETYRLSDALFIYFDNPQEEYLKVKCIPTEEGLDEYWSDFIKIPQNGTVDKPEYVLFDCPDGYRWNKYERYDENKELIEWE